MPSMRPSDNPTPDGKEFQPKDSAVSTTAETAELSPAQQLIKSAWDAKNNVFWGTAMRMVGPDEADDVLQDVFTNVWPKAEAIVAAAGSLEKVLYRAVIFGALDHLRSQKREPVSLASADPDALQLPGPNGRQPDQIAERRDDHARLHAAIAQLDYPTRLVLNLWLEDLSYVEISARANMSSERMRGLLNRGKKRLCQILRED